MAVDTTYADYDDSTYTAAERYRRRSLYLTALRSAITAELASDGYSKSTQALERLYEVVRKEHAGDTSGSSAGTNDTTSVARLVRCRDAR